MDDFNEYLYQKLFDMTDSIISAGYLQNVLDKEEILYNILTTHKEELDRMNFNIISNFVNNLEDYMLEAIENDNWDIPTEEYVYKRVKELNEKNFKIVEELRRMF